MPLGEVAAEVVFFPRRLDAPAITLGAAAASEANGSGFEAITPHSGHPKTLCLHPFFYISHGFLHQLQLNCLFLISVFGKVPQIYKYIPCPKYKGYYYYIIIYRNIYI